MSVEIKHRVVLIKDERQFVDFCNAGHADYIEHVILKQNNVWAVIVDCGPKKFAVMEKWIDENNRTKNNETNVKAYFPLNGMDQLRRLNSACHDYVEHIANGGHEDRDSDYSNAIFETALKMIKGNDILKQLNEVER